MAELIRMAKDGVVMDVHPDALKEHMRLHWAEAPGAIIADDDATSAPEDAAKRGPGRPRKVEP